MKPLHLVTPLELLPEYAGISVKLESFQPSRSFKMRGIGALCQHYLEQGALMLVSSSGGNAGYATAVCGRLLNLPVLVVVPETTSDQVIKKLRQQGAEVQQVGSVWDEAHTHALNEAEQSGGGVIHPFEHPKIWQGHATLVHELKQQLDTPPDAIVVSVGGGGLLAGVAQGLDDVGWSNTAIIACETHGAASYHAALEAGHPVTIDAITSKATTLGARLVCDASVAVSRERQVISHLCSDEAAGQACRDFANNRGILVELACGASLATLQTGALDHFENVVIVACGGMGVSLGAPPFA